MPGAQAGFGAFAVLDADGRILYASPEFARLAAASDAVLRGSALTDWFQPLPGPAPPGWPATGQAEGWLRQIQGGTELSYRAEALDPGTDRGTVLLLRDRRLALELLRARAFQLNPGLSAISVLETGEHLDVNQAWLDALEYRREEVVGRTAGELDLWEHGSPFRDQLVRQLRERGHVASQEGRLRTKSGALRDIVISAELVDLDDTRVAFFTSHDITDIKRAQAELRQLNRELEARVAERTAEISRKNEQLATVARTAQAANDAKSRFLSVMSHEIRTPLHAVTSMAEVLLEAEQDARKRDHLSVIASSARSLAAIVDDVLDVSRMEAGHLEVRRCETDLEGLCEDVVRSLAPLAHRKGVELVLRMRAGLPRTVMLDGLRLRQILFNLVGNAIKYTAAGWVQVTVGLARHQGSTGLVFDIADTGVGIDPADQERIFERYFRADPGGVDPGRAVANRTGPQRRGAGRYGPDLAGVDQEDPPGPGAPEGAGLGLSIALGLARAMDGSITVRSRRRRGSTFRLSLPVSGPLRRRPPPTWPAVTLLGAPGRTRRALEAVLATSSVAFRAAGMDGRPGSPNQPPAGIAVVVLPLASAPDAGEQVRWLRAVCGAWWRVLLLVPAGGAFTVPGDLPPEVRVETYPIGPRRLAGALSEKRGGPAQGPPAPRSATLAGTRILVIDDTDENRLVAHACLAPLGAGVVAAGSGAEALRLLRRQAFDLVLLDLRMAGLDGYQTAERIRRLPGPAAAVPIIAISADVAPDVNRMRAAGIVGFLSKPFSLLELRSTVEWFLGRGGAAPDAMPYGHGPDAGAAVLDGGFLDTHLEYAGPQVMKTVIDGFLQSLDSRLSRVQGAEGGAAHELAGAAGALGLVELARLCKRLDRSADGEAAGAAPDPQVLREVARRAAGALRAYRAGL